MAIRKINIGRGKNMSIAKAALKYYYENLKDECNGIGWFIYSGDLNGFHTIIDIAGAKHASFFTHHQVLNCIRNSPYWEVSGTTKGWNNKYANIYTPNKKGLEYYEKYLKNE